MTSLIAFYNLREVNWGKGNRAVIISPYFIGWEAFWGGQGMVPKL